MSCVFPRLLIVSHALQYAFLTVLFFVVLEQVEKGELRSILLQLIRLLPGASIVKLGTAFVHAPFDCRDLRKVGLESPMRTFLR